MTNKPSAIFPPWLLEGQEGIVFHFFPEGCHGFADKVFYQQVGLFDHIVSSRKKSFRAPAAEGSHHGILQFFHQAGVVHDMEGVDAVSLEAVL